MKKIIPLFIMGIVVISGLGVAEAKHMNSLSYFEKTATNETEYWGVTVIALEETLAPHIYNGLTTAANWKEDHIRVLWKEHATREAIIESINWLSENVDDNDIALFSFDGHGSYIHGNYGIYPYSGGDITIEDLAFLIDQISASGLIILFDCCFSGTFIKREVTGRDYIYTRFEKSIKGSLTGDNRVILMSTMPYGLGSHWIDVSLSTGEKTDTCFSSKLAEAWINQVDKNNDNICSVEESFHYAKQQLFRYSLLTASRLLMQIGCYFAYGHFYLPFPTIYDNFEGDLPLIEF